MELDAPATEDVQGGNPRAAHKQGTDGWDDQAGEVHQALDIGDNAANSQGLQEDEQAPLALDVQCNKIRGRMCLQSFQVGAMQQRQQCTLFTRLMPLQAAGPLSGGGCFAHLCIGSMFLR